jgi:hypothetical protein
MNRRALFCVVPCCLAWIAWAAVARAAGDFIILGERNAFWTNNRAAPVCKELMKQQKQHTFRSVAFTAAGDAAEDILRQAWIESMQK